MHRLILHFPNISVQFPDHLCHTLISGSEFIRDDQTFDAAIVQIIDRFRRITDSIYIRSVKPVFFRTGSGLYHTPIIKSQNYIHRLLLLQNGKTILIQIAGKLPVDLRPHTFKLAADNPLLHISDIRCHIGGKDTEGFPSDISPIVLEYFLHQLLHKRSRICLGRCICRLAAIITGR